MSQHMRITTHLNDDDHWSLLSTISLCLIKVFSVSWTSC